MWIMKCQDLLSLKKKIEMSADVIAASRIKTTVLEIIPNNKTFLYIFKCTILI